MPSPDKILVTRIDNPLKPETSPQVYRDWTPGLTAQKIADEFYPLAPLDAEVIAAVNGKILESHEIDAHELKPGDSMALWVDLKDGDALRSIAFIVVAFAAAIFAGPIVGMLGLSAPAAGASAAVLFKYGLAVAAVNMGLVAAGSLIINALLPPAALDTGVDPSPNYGWNPRINQLEQGHALPELLGKTRFAPPRIARHLTLEGDRQFYYGLYALNGDELNNLSDVFINGEAYTSLENVDINIRPGTEDQEVIDWFNDTWTLNAVQAELDTGADEVPTVVDVFLSTVEWVNFNTTESDVTEFSLNFRFPGGIYEQIISGWDLTGYIRATVSIRVEWLDYADSDWGNASTKDITWTEGMGGMIYRTHTVTTQTAKRYKIRCKLNSAMPGSLTAKIYDFTETAPIDPTLRTTTGNTVERIQCGIIFPAGLYHQADGGGLNAETVKIRVEYRPVGGSNDDWRGQNLDITDANNSPVRRVLDFQFLANGPDQYQVRVYYREAPNSGVRYSNTAYWDYIQEAVKDDFRYPGVALLAVRALATDALSGSIPRVEVIADRGDVAVSKPSNNPAWAARYVLLKSGREVIEADFTAWAAFCVTEGLEVNIYIDETINLQAALNHIGLAGRATVAPKGKNWGVYIDQASNVVQIFGDANTLAGSFKEEFLPNANVANSFEVTYWDEDLDNTPQTFELRASGVDSGDLEVKKTPIVYKGVTNRTQAVDNAVILLNHTINTRRVISFEAAADAIAVQPGDVFIWAGSRTNWGTTGRVVSATDNTVTLDQEVTLEDGQSYNILIRHQGTDVIETKSVVVPGGGATTDTLTISGTWTTNPAADAVFAFGKVNADGKEFRVLGIDRTQDQFHQIVAAEYFDSDYAGGVTVNDPPADTSWTKVQHLAVEEIWHKYPDGSGEARVNLTWTGTAIKWFVYGQWSGGGFKHLTITDLPWFKTAGLPVGIQLNFAVQAVGDTWANAETANITLTGQPDAPDIPTGVSLTEVQAGIRINWTGPAQQDLAYIGIWRNTTDSFPGGSPRYKPPAAPGEAGSFTDRAVSYDQTYYYWLKAFNHSGKASAATSSVNGSPSRTATDDIADDAVDSDKLDTGDEYNYGASGDAYMSGSDPTWRFWAGHATPASAPFRVDKDGNLYATSATIEGAVTAISGAIGNWTIIANHIYSLESGTPLSAPTDGIVLDATADMPVIRVYEDSTKRVELGWLAAGKYGLKVWNGDASAVLFEASDFQQKFAGWTFDETTIASANIILDAGNDKITVDGITIDGANNRIRSSNYVSGMAGAGFNLDPDLLEVGNIAARGIIRTAVFQKDIVSAVGGNLITRPADVLAADMTALDSANLTIEGNETFSVGDRLRIKDGTDDEWFQVTGIGSAPTYSVDRDKGGDYSADNNPAWKKGATVVNYGQPGDGFVLITASETNAPYVSVATHEGSPWDTITTRLRLGNLNGYLGYSSDIFGIGIGDATSFLKFDPTNGIQIAVSAASGITVYAGADIRMIGAGGGEPAGGGAIIFEGTTYAINLGASASGDWLSIIPDVNNQAWFTLGQGDKGFQGIIFNASDRLHMYAKNDSSNYTIFMQEYRDFDIRIYDDIGTGQFRFLGDGAGNFNLIFQGAAFYTNAGFTGTMADIGTNSYRWNAGFFGNQVDTALPLLDLIQNDVDEPFIKYRGRTAVSSLTNSLVKEGDQASETRIGWKKVEIQDSFGYMASGDYYVPFFTLNA